LQFHIEAVRQEWRFYTARQRLLVSVLTDVVWIVETR
jgi:hypothetical protein